MSFCYNCGTELTEGTAFCSNCGAAQVPGGSAPVPEAAFTDPVARNVVDAPADTLTGAAKVLSLISMICGLVSLVSCYVGFVPAIAALVLSNIAGKKAPGVPNSKARVGKITGIIGIIVSVVCFIGYVILVAANTYAFMDNAYYY